MIHVAVFGSSKWSCLMKEVLKKEYSELFVKDGGDEIVVDFFVVPGEPQNSFEISVSEFGRKYAEGELSAVIIPKEYYMQQNELVLALLRAGVDVQDIYDGIRLNPQIRNQPEAVANLITPMLQDPYLPYLEYHVADHCNLNCKYCTHYSPLVPQPVYTEYEQFAADLRQLKKYIIDIGVIRILGGEPLLNPELGRFIELTRELYPASIITVVTNGMLLDRLEPSLIEAMKRNMAFFHISFYPPLKDKVQEIQKYLYEKEIPYTITPMITEFNKTQTMTPQADEDFFYRCFQASCTCLHGGKMAPCYAPFTTKYFNAAFGQELPVEEGIDLYDEALTAPVLKAELLIPMQRCSYCISGEIRPWEIVGKHSTMEDWV